MKLNYIGFLLLLGGLFLCNNARSQSFEFGRITEQDLDLEYYREKYPEDYAVMIAEKGNCRFVYNNTLRRFQFRFERTYRLLILDERGQYLGDVNLPFYSSHAESEVISKLEANVYNMDGNKVVRERLKQKEGFVEKSGVKWNSYKLPLPNVRPGSVIEVSYTLTSIFMSQLRGWQFQYDYPVEYSEYELILPSIFLYRRYYRGFVELDETRTHDLVENFRVQRIVTGLYGAKLERGFMNYSINSDQFSWVARNVPAFRQEPYTDNYRNYLASMNFEFVGEQYPDTPPEYVSKTWDDVSRFLYEDEDFGGFLEKARKELQSNITFTMDDGGLKHNMDKALSIIRDLVRWDEYNSIYSGSSPSQVLKVGQGNSAEVNMLLCALLQNAGVDAHPVLLRTRERGGITGDSPTIIQFNYLMVGVPDSTDNVILLDATEGHLMAGYIPERAVNGQGRMISPTTSSWVNLENPGQYHMRKIYDLELNADGSLSGSMQYHFFDYAKILGNQVLNLGWGSEKIIEFIGSDLDAFISDHSVVSNDGPENPLIIAGTFHKADFFSPIAGEIFLNPLLFESFKNEVFREEERLYPVFFDHRSLSEIELKLKLPEGMSVSEAPSDQIIRWGNNLVYDYKTSVEQNTLTINCRMLIGTQKIDAKYYSAVKSFFDRIIRKNLEQLVLNTES